MSSLEAAAVLRQRATAVVHGGWTYTDDLDGLLHIRYEGDWSGYDHPFRRVVRAARSVGRLILDRPTAAQTWFGLGRRSWLDTWAFIKAHLRTEKHLPDGTVGPLICPWMEDGLYVELVQPKVGVLVADWLEAAPDSPHAKAIAEAILGLATHTGIE